MTQPTNVKFAKGAFVAYQPTVDPATANRAIPFRFNPESLTRTVALQTAPPPSGTEGAQTQNAAQQKHQATSPDAGATVKESFTITIRVDAADRDQALAANPKVKPEFGVAPEIAALENLLYPATQTPAKAASTGKQAVSPVDGRPLVLLVWGPKRVVPVRIASLKIAETLYNAMLYPIRAEIEVSLEVLGLAEAKDDKTVAAALDFTDAKRRELANLFYDSTAAQGQGLVAPLKEKSPQ